MNGSCLGKEDAALSKPCHGDRSCPQFVILLGVTMVGFPLGPAYRAPGGFCGEERRNKGIFTRLEFGGSQKFEEKGGAHWAEWPKSSGPMSFSFLLYHQHLG